MKTFSLRVSGWQKLPSSKKPASAFPRLGLAGQASRGGMPVKTALTPLVAGKQTQLSLAPSGTKHPTNEDGLAEALWNQALATLQGVGW
jgi:hypothetical protein